MLDDISMNLASGIAAFEAKEFRRAWQLLDPLAEAGSAEAQYRCSVMLQNGLGVIARPSAAARMMTQAAEQEYGLAQHSLGVMYLYGEGVEQSTQEAVRLLEMSGCSGLAGSWSTLGMIFKEGIGIDADESRARDYYVKAGFDPDEIT